MKALVLLSGGVDSATCLGLAVRQYGAAEVLALSVYYGQTHSKELAAAQKVADFYGVVGPGGMVGPAVVAFGEDSDGVHMACLQCLLELRFAEAASDTGYFSAGMEVQVYLTEIHEISSFLML